MSSFRRNDTYLEKSPWAPSKMNMILEVYGMGSVQTNSSYREPKSITAALQFMEITPTQAENIAAHFERMADDIRDGIKDLRPATAEVMK